jgi:hypothetical protein
MPVFSQRMATCLKRLSLPIACSMRHGGLDDVGWIVLMLIGAGILWWLGQ